MKKIMFTEEEKKAIRKICLFSQQQTYAKKISRADFICSNEISSHGILKECRKICEAHKLPKPDSISEFISIISDALGC